MAGHSKWANIKHRKAAQDARRGKLFAKLIRAIENSAREAGTSDPEASSALELAIQKAKDAEVPKENIERAAKRGAGELAGAATYEAAQYEGYAPGGVAVLVECLTDNRNRTASDMRGIFAKSGGNLAEPGAVSFLFSRRGHVILPDDDVTEDDIMVAGLDAGLEEVERADGTWTAWCQPSDVKHLRVALEDNGLRVERSGTTMVPASTVPITTPEDARKVLRLMDMLDDNDDVQDIYANFDIPDEVLEEVSVAS